MQRRILWWIGAVVAVAAGSLGQGQERAPASLGSGSRWVQAAYLKASNAEAGDHFGCGGALDGHAGNSVAVSGDGTTLAIGAPHESSGGRGVGGDQDDNSLFSAGAVYVFARRGDRWVQEAYLKPSNPQRSAQFGWVVALSADGNTLAVSAVWESSGATGVNGNQDDRSVPQAGAVYVFVRSAGLWRQQAYLKASNTGEAGTSEQIGEGDQFGFSLALSADGNTLAVGATGEDSSAAGINRLAFQTDNQAPNSGAVYVFVRTGTTWSQQAYLKASNSEATDLFGYAVALSADGNTLAVGAFDEDGSARTINGLPDNRAGNAGAAYVFVRSGSDWREEAYIKASATEANDAWGAAVALSADGNTLAVSALDEDCLVPAGSAAACDHDADTDTSAGAVAVFVRRGGTWIEEAFLKPSNPGPGDWFGTKIALSADGHTLAVGASLEDSAARGVGGRQDHEAAPDSGAVYIFRRSGATWQQQAYLKASNADAYDEFGGAVALSADGRVLVVGARGEDSAARGVNGDQADNSADESGAAYVFTLR
jgi:hypothetical protein